MFQIFEHLLSQQIPIVIPNMAKLQIITPVLKSDLFLDTDCLFTPEVKLLVTCFQTFMNGIHGISAHGKNKKFGNTSI